MKFYRRQKFFLLGLFAFGLGLSFSFAVEAQSTDVNFLVNAVRPHVQFILDCSGSMTSQVPAASANPFPGCQSYTTVSPGPPAVYALPNPLPPVGPPYLFPANRDADCDSTSSDGGDSRMDTLIAVMRGLLDTDNSSIAPGDPNWYTPGSDDLGIQLGIINFQGGAIPTASPSLTDQPTCSGGTTIRHRILADNDLSRAEEIFGGLRASGTTPLADTFDFYRTDSGALPYLISNDPYNSCRKRIVVLITDGEDTCNPGHLHQAASDLTTALSATTGGPKIYAIGFAADLSAAGEAALNDVASTGGSDANGDGDNDPTTWCASPNHNNKGGFNAACNGCNGATPSCPGNAYFVTSGQDVSSALNSIFDQLQTGSYTLSTPTIALARGSRTGIIASYFTVGSTPVWGPGLEQYILNTATGQYTDPKWCTSGCTKPASAVEVVGHQPSTGTYGRRNYTLDPNPLVTNGQIVEFTNAAGIVGGGAQQFSASRFFSATTTRYDDFDSNGTTGDTADAQAIVDWFNGNNTSNGNPLRWRTGSNATVLNSTTWPFGPIIHSEPVVVGVPNDPLHLLRNGYADFITSNAERDRITIVNTNTIIAAINDISPDDPSPNNVNYTDGQLLWGYVPKANISHLRETNVQTPKYIDGKGLAIDWNAGTETSPIWQTSYCTPLGSAMRGVTCINITDTKHPGNGSSQTMGNWEILSSTTGFGNLGLAVAPLSFIEVRDSTDPNLIHPLLVVPAGLSDISDVAHRDNGRSVFFVSMTSGAVVREVKIGDLYNVSHDFIPFYTANTPGGITAKVEQTTDTQGFTNGVYIGTQAGQVYAFPFVDFTDLTTPTTLARLVWDARDITLAAETGFAGDGNGSIDYTVGPTCNPPSCELANPRDMPVVKILPVHDTATTINLLVYFGPGLNSDEFGMPSPITPRGAILRYIDPNGTNFNVQRYIAQPTGASANLASFGQYLLPRQLYHNDSIGKPDRILSWENMFVANFNLFYLLYRPSPTPCSGTAASYLAKLNLISGLDMPVDPAIPNPAPNNAANSVENYLKVADAQASMVVDFTLGKFYFGSVNNSTHQISITNQTIPLGLPNGIIQTIMMM